MSYKLEKPYTNKQKSDFIVKYNHNTGLRIAQSTKTLYALEEWEALEEDTVINHRKVWEQEQIQKEYKRIKQLYMTRSDFFDGTIKAFDVDENDLLFSIEKIFLKSKVNDLEKKVALNNYKNALHFYRFHPLFDMLSGVEIPVSETESITITSQQWDTFFDETNKKNPNAWEVLLPSVSEEELNSQNDELESEEIDE